MKRPGLRADVRIALLYMFFSGAWILFSDRLLAALVKDADMLTRIQTYKGWGFVVVSALLIFVLLRRELALRRSAEQKLIESQARYQLISRVASDYMFYSKITADGGLQLDWVTGAFEAITGYTLAEYNAHGGWRATLHPDDRDADARDLEKLRANQPIITEVRTFTKQGAVIWVRVYAHPVISDQDRTLTGIYGAVQDITERKEAEADIRRRSEEFAALYEIARDLAAQRSLPTLLESIVNHTARLLATPDAVIYLYHPAQDEFELAATRIEMMPLGTRFNANQGASGQVLRTRRPLIIDNYRAWAQRRPSLQHIDLTAVAQVPMIYDNDIIGVLGIGWSPF